MDLRHIYDTSTQRAQHLRHWLHQYNPDALACGAIVSLRPELPLPGDLPDPVQDPLNTTASERR